MAWTLPSENAITGTTLINQADNKIQASMNDLEDYINSTGDYLGAGLAEEQTSVVNISQTQTITGAKTFSSVITADGGVAGDVTGNTDTATKLATARTITLTGDVTGSVSFDGSANASITATVVDDSHNHVIDNVDGLQTALDAKQATLVSGTNIKTVNGQNIVGSGNVDLPHATSSVYGTIKAYVSGTTLYVTL